MNPFRFGNVVTGEYFTNRIKEIKEIVSEINADQHIVLISPRRYGKTSLEESRNGLNPSIVYYPFGIPSECRKSSKIRLISPLIL